MRKFILIFLAVGFFFALVAEDTERTNSATRPEVSQPIVAAPKAKTHLFVTGSRVNQRVAPGTAQQVLGQLFEGDKVRQLSVDGEWTEIVSSLGRGWMHSAYLSESVPAPKPKVTQPKTRQVSAPSSREIANAKKEIIRQSIRSYPGSCPCPYNRDRAGRRCGGRSAWSKPGGYSPICYESDVSRSRLSSYFARRRGASN